MPRNKIFSLVTIPIGNPQDITLRAIETLKNAQLLLCEEIPVAEKLLKRLEIPFYKGEFNSKRSELYLFLWDRKSGKGERDYLLDVLPAIEKACYISGCGSPVFEDPGVSAQELFSGFQLEYIPGVSSLGALMMHFGEPSRSFKMHGFLPRQKEAREQELISISRARETVFLMETPYRMHKLLGDLEPHFKNWNLLFGYCLTTDREQVFQGKFSTVKKQLQGLEANEFVLFLIPESGKSPRAPGKSTGKKGRKKRY